MLVLSRKLQEKIRIGKHITITIVRIQGNTVRVGIEAPEDVRVVRGELATADASAAESEHGEPAVGGQEASMVVEEVEHLLPLAASCARARARQRRRLRRQAAGFDALA